MIRCWVVVVDVDDSVWLWGCGCVDDSMLGCGVVGWLMIRCWVVVARMIRCWVVVARMIRCWVVVAMDDSVDDSVLEEVFIDSGCSGFNRVLNI